MGLYDRDFHAWAAEQAELSRARAHNALDWDNVAEELEDLAEHVRRELEARFRDLQLHLLKFRVQPGLRSRSWETIIENQRADIQELLAENPSLGAHADDLYAAAYAGAVRDAVQETGLPKSIFSPEPPYSREQALDAGFWPEAMAYG